MRDIACRQSRANPSLDVNYIRLSPPALPIHLRVADLKTWMTLRRTAVWNLAGRIEESSCAGVSTMLRNRIRIFVPSVLAALMMAGCHDPEPTITMNSPPGSEDADRTTVGEYFAYHNDQGMMADLSIADMHFIADSEHLSGIGEARLERYAELLATSGGKLHYDTRIDDAVLVDARLRVAREFLMQVSPGSKRIDVVLGMPRGRGMDAIESAAGRGVAQQPEPRGPAYHLAGSIESGGSGN